MSEPDWPPKLNKKGKYVSFDDPITNAAVPSSSPSASSGAVQVVPTQCPSQTTAHVGSLTPTQAGPTHPARLPIYRPVSNVYRGPRSVLQAGFQAAPPTMSFSDHINQTNNIVYANIRGRPLLQPEFITRAHEALCNVEPARVRDLVSPSMGMASAYSTPWITETDAPLPPTSSAGNTHVLYVPNGELSLYDPSNKTPDQEEARYEADEDTQDLNQDNSSNSGPTLNRPLHTVQEQVASSLSHRNDPLDELRYLMVENKTSTEYGHAALSFIPTVPSTTQFFRPALSSNTQSSGSTLRPITLAPPPGLPIHRPSALRPTTLVPPPGLPIIRPSASIYHQFAHPVASYTASESSSAGSSSSRSTPYMGSGSFAPRPLAPDPYAPTSRLSRPILLADNNGSTGTSATSPSKFRLGLTNNRNVTVTASGRPPSADQNYQGNLNSGSNADGVRDENGMENSGFPGQIPQQQNSAHYGSHQQHSFHRSLPTVYGGGFVQQPDRSGLQEVSALMHAQPRPGNSHRQDILFREPSRNRQVFQNRPRTPYTPSRSPSAYLLFEDPPGTVIPDDEGLNPYEIRDREAAADALLRLNSEDEDEVDLTLERLHSRRRRLENEARSLRLEQDEDRVWNLLEEKEAKNSRRG